MKSWKYKTPEPIEKVSALVDEVEADMIEEKEIVNEVELNNLPETNVVAEMPEVTPAPEPLDDKEKGLLREIIDHAIARSLTSNKKVNDRLQAQKGLLLKIKNKL